MDAEKIQEARARVVPGSAEDLRLQAAFRAACVAELGWEPEDPAAGPGDRYAATTGELWVWVQEARRGVASA